MVFHFGQEYFHSLYFRHHFIQLELDGGSKVILSYQLEDWYFNLTTYKFGSNLSPDVFSIVNLSTSRPFRRLLPLRTKPLLPPPPNN